MSTAADKIARLDRSIARTGETVTIQRTSTDSTTGAVSVIEEVVCPAHVRAHQPQDLIEQVREHAIVISATPLIAETGSPPAAFGLPAKDDRIVIQGDTSNIAEVSPIYYGGALVRVNLLCQG